MKNIFVILLALTSFISTGYATDAVDKTSIKSDTANATQLKQEKGGILEEKVKAIETKKYNWEFYSYEEFEKKIDLSQLDNSVFGYRDQFPDAIYVYHEGDISIDGNMEINKIFDDLNHAAEASGYPPHSHVYGVWIAGDLRVGNAVFTSDYENLTRSFVVQGNVFTKRLIVGGIYIQIMGNLNTEIAFHMLSAEGWLGVKGTKNIKIETDINQIWTIHDNQWDFSDGISGKEKEQIFKEKSKSLEYDEDSDLYYLEEDVFIQELLEGDNLFNSSEFLADKMPDAAKKWKDSLSPDEDYEGVYADLEQNYLDHIPQYIAENQQITSLNLTDNKFKDFPVEIAEMKNLKYLDLSGNPIAKLPEVAVDTELEVFLYYDSPQLALKDVVEFAGKMPKLNSLGFSSKHKSSVDLDTLSDGLDGLIEQEIDNLITSIIPWKQPADNPKLDKFKESLRFKEDEHPPVDFPEKLTEVEEVYLHDLRFKTLCLKKPMANLTTLSLSGSVYSLQEAPRWEDFPSLKSLDLSLNRWVASEPELKIIESLKYLPKRVTSLKLDYWKSFDPDVMHAIRKIPALIAHLDNLEHLSFIESQIDPDLLVDLLPKLSNLKELDIEGVDLSFFQRRSLIKAIPAGCEVEGLDD